MEILDLLWELQELENHMENIKLKLQDISSGKSIQLLITKLNQTEDRLHNLEKRLEDTEVRLNRNNFILKDLDFQLKEIEKDLYDGHIMDLKQLNYLDNEREKIKKEIEQKEMEILLQMEEMENLKGEFVEIEKDFKLLKKEYTKLIKKHKKIIKKFKEQLKTGQEKTEILCSNIDKDILKIYTQLKKNKGNAITQVVDNKCNGCNMLLPTYVVDRLNNHKEIIHCENCDRILYLVK